MAIIDLYNNPHSTVVQLYPINRVGNCTVLTLYQIVPELYRNCTRIVPYLYYLVQLLKSKLYQT
jgi:hypothetical protein